jgi:folate-binding Fe-S cluster repair protein YgfZ
MRPQGILTRNAECNREEAVRWPTWTLEIRTKNSINVSVTPEMKLQRNLEQNFKQTPNEHPNETLNDILQKLKKTVSETLKNYAFFFGKTIFNLLKFSSWIAMGLA